MLCDVLLVNTDDARVEGTIRQVQKWLTRTGAPVRIRNVEQNLFTPPRFDAEDVWGWATRQPKSANGATTAVIYVVQGAGGFAGGNAEARTAVVGDVFIEAVQGEWAAALSYYPMEDAARWRRTVTRDAQIGSFLHEMSHMDSNLNHESGGLMAEPWKWPWVGWPEQPKWLVWLNAIRWKLGV